MAGGEAPKCGRYCPVRGLINKANREDVSKKQKGLTDIRKVAQVVTSILKVISS